MEDTRFGVTSRFKLEDIREGSDFVYKPRSETMIPEEVTSEFEAKGFRLRWVRYSTDGVMDTVNLRRSINQEGFEFVRPEDLEQAGTLGDLAKLQGYGECVTLGDLVLMKVPAYKADARKKYIENETRKRLQAVKEKLEQNAIENGSRTVTKIGKGAARYANE